jgi:hypothetical protein
MNDLQNRRFMINYMKDIECISRIPHWFLLEKYANRNQSERFKARDQAALNLPPSWELWGCTKEATNIRKIPRVKGSYYVVNRVLYSYMYDYTSVYEKKICRINTEISRFITTAFPQTVATTPHYSSGIINRTKDQSLQRLLAIFPLFLFLTQIEPFCLHFICLSSKEETGEKMVSHLCHFRFEVG